MERVNKRRLPLPQLTQISDLVRAQMKEQGVTAQQLAESAGVKELYFAKILAGTSRWTLHVLIEVAQVLTLRIPGMPDGALETLARDVDDMRLVDRQLPRFADFLHKVRRIQSTEQHLALSQVLEALALLGAHAEAEKETTEVLVVDTSEQPVRRGSGRTRQTELEHRLLS